MTSSASYGYFGTIVMFKNSLFGEFHRMIYKGIYNVIAFSLFPFNLQSNLSQ